MTRTRHIALFALLFSSPALADEAVTVEVVAKAQKGRSLPGLIVRPQVDAETLDVRVECGGAWAEHKGSAGKGEEIHLELDVNPGAYTCTGELSGVFADETEGEMPLNFQIEMFAPLSVTVSKEQVDLDAHTLAVVLDRPAGKVEVAAFGAGGTKLGEGTAPAEGTPAGTPIAAQWQQAPGEVLRIEVTAHDADGFWSKLDLFPWFYAVPHEDVVFSTNEAVIRPMEVDKLQAALGEVQKVVAKYGADIPMNLYVGGYTDSVGDHTQNRFLSDKRAAAISKWFADTGFSGQIWYQGFGEDGQAVITPDEVDEQRNRRAVYVVAAEAPPVSKEMPRSTWVRLH